MFNQPFYMMRHGETDWNNQGLIMGQKDIPLNKKGEKQAEQAQEILKDLRFGQVFSSPLKRARRTAEIATAPFYDSSKIIYISKLMECHWGVLQGKTKLNGNETFMAQWRAGEVTEKAESFADFQGRVISAIQLCLEKNRAADEVNPPLIVAHGGLFWVLDQVLGMPAPYLMQNCEVVYVEPFASDNGLYRIIPMKYDDFERVG